LWSKTHQGSRTKNCHGHQYDASMLALCATMSTEIMLTCLPQPYLVESSTHHLSCVHHSWFNLCLWCILRWRDDP